MDDLLHLMLTPTAIFLLNSKGEPPLFIGGVGIFEKKPGILNIIENET